jgi:hypothetical protein
MIAGPQVTIHYTRDILLKKEKSFLRVTSEDRDLHFKLRGKGDNGLALRLPGVFGVGPRDDARPIVPSDYCFQGRGRAA